MQKVTILDIPFDQITKQQALAIVTNHLAKNTCKKQFFIATPNPEMLLEARRNPHFKKILQQTDLNIPDGIGIIMASRLLKKPLPERITGVDFMLSLCETFAGTHKVFLLGAAAGIAEKVKYQLDAKIPHLQIVGTHSGSPAPEEEKIICRLIQKSDAEILFVAFGAPKQELWIARNLHYLTSVRLVMGVGGAFDFLAGVRKRAPRFVQKLGLEWLYRLSQEPSRLRRIFNATVKFPFVFLKNQKKYR